MTDSGSSFNFAEKIFTFKPERHVNKADKHRYPPKTPTAMARKIHNVRKRSKKLKFFMVESSMHPPLFKNEVG